MVNLPGCPVQPDNITQTLLRLVLQLAHAAPRSSSTSRAAPSRSSAAPCTRGAIGPASRTSGEFSESHGDGRCLVKLGCRGPVVRCNVPVRGWVNGVGGCPNVGGICMACTMPGFPDKFMPFMEPTAGAKLYARTATFAHGRLVKHLRERRMRRNFDVEPQWRRPGELASGYKRPA